MITDLSEAIQYCLDVAEKNEKEYRENPEQLGYEERFYDCKERVVTYRQLVVLLKELEMSRKHLNYMLYCLEKYDDEHCINEIYSELARYDSDMDEFRGNN